MADRKSSIEYLDHDFIYRDENFFSVKHDQYRNPRLSGGVVVQNVLILVVCGIAIVDDSFAERELEHPELYFDVTTSIVDCS